MDPDTLRRWLADHGFTRERLAGALEVHETTVYRWLNGSVAIPRTVELALLGLEVGEEDDRKS
jgi:transcriptional regulator with XRE-family HTH domain